MKNLVLSLVFILLLLPSFAQGLEFVDDQANLIEEEDEILIRSALRTIFDSGKAEFRVVTVINLGGRDIESYALDLVQGKLGNKDNNGLLLLISLEESKYRFEVGRGLEPIFNDAKIGRIGRDYLVPNFKEGNFGLGILQATAVISNELEVDLNSSSINQNIYLNSRNEVELSKSQTISILIVFLIIFFGIYSFTDKRKSKKQRLFEAAIMASYMFGGRGGRGGRGGSGGSFGGGGFGGGGASGGF